MIFLSNLPWITQDFLIFIKLQKTLLVIFIEILLYFFVFRLVTFLLELSFFGKNKISNQIIDTLTPARDKFPGSPVSLDALCKRYRIDNSKRTQHTALIDCDLLAKVYINLIDQKEPTLNFHDDEKKINKNKITRTNYYKKVVIPAAEELKKHKEYLKNNFKKFFF